MSRAIVRKVDHVLLRTDDVRSLFNFLTQELQLPVAWPLFPYLDWLSGAVSIGRVNLEVLEPLPANTSAEALRPGTRLIGLAFEPYELAGAVTELEARGLEHEAPWDYRLEDSLGWTSVQLGSWEDCPLQLLVKYHRDQDKHWAKCERHLAQQGGGPLGVLALEEVVVGARDPLQSVERWRGLLAPTPHDGGRWAFEAGPGLWFEKADSDRLCALGIAVRNLGEAVHWLEGRGHEVTHAEGQAVVRLAPEHQVELRLHQR